MPIDDIIKNMKILTQCLKQAQRVSESIGKSQRQIARIMGGIDLYKLNLYSQLPHSYKLMQQLSKVAPLLKQKYQPLGIALVEQNKEWGRLRNQLLSVAQKAAETTLANQQKFHRIGMYAFQAFQNIARTFPPNLYTTLSKLVIKPEVINERINQHALFCYYFGWPPLMHIPIITNTVEDMLENCSEEEAKQLFNDAILKAYNKDVLNQVLEGWKECDFLKDRMPILGSVIEAHQQEQYWLTVPTILPQLEGLLYVARKTGSSNVKKEFHELLQNDKFRKSNEIVRIYLTDRVYKSYKRGDNLPFDLSRNAILHGDHLNYGNSVISLKAILLFDYLVNTVKKIFESDEDGE